MSSLSTRRQLFNKDPYCFWCGCLTTLGVDNPRLNTLATVDHLYSRQHPLRSRRKHLKVLACFGCNQRRNNCESKGIYFMPKLLHRLDVARDSCATLARAIVMDREDTRNEETKKSSVATLRAVSPAEIVILKEEYEREVKRKQPMRVIQTFEAAVEFAKENPAR